MQRETLEWAIERAFASLDRRARVVERLIADHRSEFGDAVGEPSLDAICIAMATLTALAKYRFESETERYPEQFRRLLREYATTTFADRVSIPELQQTGAERGLSEQFVYAVARRFSLPMPGAMYPPHDDPLVNQFSEWLNNEGLTEPPELWRFFHSSLIYEKYRNPVFSFVTYRGWERTTKHVDGLPRTVLCEPHWARRVGSAYHYSSFRRNGHVLAHALTRRQ